MEFLECMNFGTIHSVFDQGVRSFLQSVGALVLIGVFMGIIDRTYSDGKYWEGIKNAYLSNKSLRTKVRDLNVAIERIDRLNLHHKNRLDSLQEGLNDCMLACRIEEEDKKE